MGYAKPSAKPPAKFNPTQFRVRLRGSREGENITQQQLAKKAGLTAAAISHFECGNRVPSVENFYKLCRALGASANDLMGLE